MTPARRRPQRLRGPRRRGARRASRRPSPPHAAVLHRSEDADHHRAVFLLAGEPGTARTRRSRPGAAAARAAIDLRRHDGLHPRVGALDVAPVVYLDDARARRRDRGGPARGGRDRRRGHPRLPLRRARRRAHPRRAAPRRARDARRARRPTASSRPTTARPPSTRRRGATLVAARPPLIAFNLELAPPATLDDARAVAARIREGGAEGLPGVRALGLHLERQDIVQVSTNIEDHRAVPRARRARRRGAPPRRRRGGARRARAGGGAGRLAGRRPAAHAGLHRGPARAANLSRPMAQTKRKRRSKHRGTAAGTVESRGRTGRKPTPEERKKADAAAQRDERLYREPTWRERRDARRLRRASMLLRALPDRHRAEAGRRELARASRCSPSRSTCRSATDRPGDLEAPHAQGGAAAAALQAALADGRPQLHRRPGRRELPHRAPRRRARGGDDRPRRRARAPARGRRRARPRRSRPSSSPTRTSTTSAPSRRSPAPPARRCGAPSSRCPVLADIMRYVPWPGFGPYESYDADHTVAGGETLQLAGPGHRGAVHARATRRATSPTASPTSRPSSPATCCSQGSIGRTDLPGGDTATLMRTLGELLDLLPDETTVYPGHMGVTTIGRERATQPVPRPAGMSRRIQAPRGTFDVLGEHALARDGLEAHARRILERAGYGRIETPDLRGHGAVRPRRRGVHGRRAEADVHVRRRRRPVATRCARRAPRRSAAPTSSTGCTSCRSP